VSYDAGASAFLAEEKHPYFHIHRYFGSVLAGSKLQYQTFYHTPALVSPALAVWRNEVHVMTGHFFLLLKKNEAFHVAHLFCILEYADLA
jgi:hypothetical protein